MNKIYNRDSVNRDLILNRKRSWRWLKLVSLCLVFFTGTATFAQVAEYTFSQSEGTYESIESDGDLVAGSEATTTVTNDGSGWTVSIPFSFSFNASNYNSIYVNSNGGATFGATTSTSSSLISATTTYSGAISVMNRDLWGVFITSGVTTIGSNVITNVASFRGMAVGKVLNGVNGIPTGSTVTDFDEEAQTITMSNNATSSAAIAVIRYGTGKIFTKVEGTTPNRVFTIQWEGYNDYNTAVTGSNYLSFQLKLSETSNKIEIVYGENFNLSTSSITNQIGLRGASNADYNNRTGTVTNPWTSTTAGTTNSASVARNNVNFPSTGLTFAWAVPVVTTPPNCATAHFPADLATNVGRNVTLSWGAPSSPAATSYDIYLGTSPNPPLLGNVTTTSAAITPPLAASTMYYWKVVPKNQIGNAIGCIERSFTTGTDVIYCTPSYTYGCSDGGTINDVATISALTNISNLATGCASGAAGYTNYSATKEMSASRSTSFSIQVGITAYGSGVKVWIDYNQNGIFEDGEIATQSAASIASGANYNGTISIPNTALLGVTRMRVRAVEGTTIFNACSAYSYGETEDYKITILEAPSCVAPSALVSSSITINSATLSWTAPASSPSNGYDVYYSTTNTAPLAATAPTVDNHNASSLNVTGLNTSSTYYWWVRSDCGSDSSAWASGGSFVTLCVESSIPYTMPIEAVVTPALPICTSIQNINNDASTWVSTANPGATSEITGKVMAYSYNTANAANDWLYTNSLALTSGTTYQLKFKYRNASFVEKLKVGIGTSAVNTAMTTTLFDVTTGSVTATVSQVITFTVPTSGNYNIGFQCYSAADQNVLYLGEISVIVAPTCVAPTVLSASSIGFNTANLSWTSEGSSFDVEYGTQGYVQGEGTTETVSENSYPLTGLSSGTNYSFYVRNLCGGGDGNSSWAGPFNFTTLSKASVPWAQDFATNSLPAGWVNGGFTVSTTTALAPDATTNYLYKNLWSSGPNANVQTIYVGELGANDRLKFNYKLANYDAPYTVPESGSGNFKVEIQQFPSEIWVEVATVANNGIEGWQEVSYDLAAYAGEVVRIRITGNWISGDYYLGLDNFSIAPSCPTGVWVGATSTAWNTASNWADNMVPQPCTDVTVNETNPLVISSNVDVASISVGANANVTVTGTLNVGDVTVAAGGMMTVANDAAILQTALAVNTGMVTVKRNSTELFRQDYTLWSSPVTGQNLRAFSTQTLFNRFSSYDTTIGTNGNYVQEIVTTADMNTKTFGTAKGYLIRMPNNWVEIGSSNPAQPYLGSFTGSLNNGEITIALSGANSKLNLVGNPYASPISIAAFFAANTNINETLYFWRKKGSQFSIASGYATYTSMGLASADTDIDGTMPTNIETGQGFFVVANSAAPGNLVFNNSMRNNGAATFYKGATTTELHRFWLNLSDATNVVGQTLIGYKTGATQGVDAGVDAMYFNDSSTALTSLINDAEYIIQGRNIPFVNSDIVPLGFKTDVAGNFTISLSNFDGLFAENQDIFLKDNVTGIVHDLKLADYTFATPVGVYNTRFEVQYTNSTLGTDNPISADHAILIGVKDQKIQINAGSVVMEKIDLIDVSGRVIYTQEGVNATTATLENVVSSNQMLIVRISTKENGVVNQKIIF